MINLAMAYHNGDRDQVIRWMTWVKELGGLGDHKLYTIAAFDCEPVPDTLPNVRLPDHEKLRSDWQSTNPARSAAAPNSMFRTFAWHFHLNKLGAWMFIEPDCVPTKKSWHDQLEAEHIRGDKAFTGAHVLIDKVPEHMSGNGIYHQDTVAIAPTLTMRTNWTVEGRDYELAFDIAGARETLKHAHFTKLIQHHFRHPGFKSRAEFDALIDPQAVVFHSCKDGSIFKYLKGGDASCPATVMPIPIDDGTTTSVKPLKSTIRQGSNAAPTVQPAGAATFPKEARRLSEELSALAHDAYHRRKVRDALKKVGLI